MKKKINLILILIFLCTMTSSCKIQHEAVVIKSKNTFNDLKQKTHIENTKIYDNVVDLSEGPRLNYDRYLGPKQLNFDFKIIAPY